MQLMAAVKLSTGRPITNHPHFEDKSLRIRTAQLYQMYGRFPPAAVHAILNHYGASYVILEDTICLAPNRGDGCRLTDLVDVSNGMMPAGESSVKWPADLAISATPRFCDAIRLNTPDFARFFKLVHSSRTFRVYKLLPL
ncbi:hypothetical protein CAPTEDRAFT_98001 [Capitella teleta]|uniref:Uncharacterized protein n=1 Tax=Capitella teleta TaxID=283909 RepID=R7T825_CAPTE|nr:hypothetical protein CAPTEDRAFT_98001 [Capitella teleta]|eukprot:ELT89745.1 hypothetical protein CAPTEDRAFT_98001 [Capitella teleta]